ncbi:hypothetical protein X801_07561, partial [Opisthorchis viverrini]
MANEQRTAPSCIQKRHMCDYYRMTYRKHSGRNVHSAVAMENWG